MNQLRHQLTMMNVGYLLGSGKIKDAEALVAQVAAGNHPNITTGLARLNADVAMGPESDPLPPGFVDNDHDGHG